MTRACAYVPCVGAMVHIDVRNRTSIIEHDVLQDAAERSNLTASRSRRIASLARRLVESREGKRRTSLLRSREMDAVEDIDAGYKSKRDQRS